MIRRLYRKLPGSPPVRIALTVLIILLALVLLAVVFEQAGGLLDTGGVIQ